MVTDPWVYRVLDLLFARADIIGGGQCKYLHRWQIRRSRSLGCYLHHFVGSDRFRDCHDHTRRVVSIGLWGRYWEVTPDGNGNENARLYQAPWVRTFPATHIHRVVLQPGGTCWTLVVLLPISREWGFWPRGKWVAASDYLARLRANKVEDC